MVNFRQIKDTDIEQIRIWRNSDIIKNVSYDRSYITKERQESWYEKIKDDNNQIHYIITLNNKNIGYAAIKNIDLKNKRCEFASLYIGDDDHLLSGIGAVAEYKILDFIFKTFAIDKIYCEVILFNQKVIRLHKRFGFIEEGVLKKHYFLEDKFQDVCLLALFREDWLNNKNKLSKILKV